MNKAKILIVGAGGQVGHALSIADTPYQLIALTRNDLDITDRSLINKIIKKSVPDIIINAAAYTAVDKAEDEKEMAFAINRDAVKYLADICADIQIPLLHISTDYVFDGNKSSAYLETDLVSPLGVYGKSKAEGETVLRQTLQQHFILRTSWVFSATGSNFVKTMLRLGEERDELSIVADQKGCPTSATSIANVLLMIADKYLRGDSIEWGTYHFANQKESTWLEFARAIFAVSKKMNNSASPKITAIKTSEYITPAKRPLNSVLDCSKLERVFGGGSTQWQDELIKVVGDLK
ncbi:MAG: dTDP-4-dehydrorhamnose reductase [Gammaproteobacteria bacterium]|nr:dTDP-4-dehydrorhamnose reductase [Gammaproteobacteria bacterium]